MNILNMFSSIDVTYLRHMFPKLKVKLVPLTPSSSWLDNDSSVAESGTLVVSPTTSSSVDEVPDDDPSWAESGALMSPMMLISLSSNSWSDTIPPSGTGCPRVSGGAEMRRRPSIRRTKMRLFMMTGNKFDVDLMRLSPTLKRLNSDVFYTQAPTDIFRHVSYFLESMMDGGET